MIRRFYLKRNEDVSGVSGTGSVAEGVVFSDGTAVLRWTTDYQTWGLYDSIEELDAIHSHDGATVIIWED